ncbi:alpha/beta hydrolase [Anaerobacillus alkalilacustris]|uniref:Alpha/beta hydrolase n=1 Tax=Anaerobacillus alkalilacustris TaxID=393763 RepID=A0A1S2LSL8_9BACI|nr:alpha/beta hydrolase [Anaerobacillus alkalilacustris]OIJ14667.1 alpha/beta hydrolase [Anaerobacillus alkalilacustris]
MSILLWPEGAPFSKGKKEEDIPLLTPFIVEGKEKNGAMIVCPGGGYSHRAKHEGAPICEWLNSIGISAFLLDYRVSPNNHPVPLLDAKRALRYVRYHAEKWEIDEAKIGILGFSAGGHLAATLGTQFDLGDPNSSDPIDKQSCKPDVMVLCYPVISFVEHYHEGSINMLLGEESTEEERMLLSVEKQVTENTPPTFLWHTADDASVPVENSLALSKSLSRHNVPFELHIFQNGRHGLGLATKENLHVAQWTDLCNKWLKKQGY